MAARRPTTIQLESLSKKYELGEYLASGGCGTVMTCTLKDNPEKGKYVLKYINVAELTKNKAAGSEREARLMSKLHHNNIVRLIDVFECDEKLHLIMEYCDGGDLRKKIRQKINNQHTGLGEDTHFSYETIRFWMIQLSQALKVIHAADIVHRDIKPENIFLHGPTDTVKIGDLGISRSINVHEGERAKTRIGTPRYVSPEVLKGEDYLFSTDVWSLGILLCELCTLDRVVIRPEKRKKKVACFTCGEENYVELPAIDRKYGKEMKEIAKKMLKEKPNERPSAAELVIMFQNLPATRT